jgi:hypothetical protein
MNDQPKKDFAREDKYIRAKKRVKEISGFYWHLFFYLLINIGLLVFSNNIFREGELFEWQNYSTAFFWGIGLFLHWFGVFGKNLLFSKDWEERKIKEFMEREK